MFATQPSGYLIRSFPKSFSKLFFIQTLFMHKCIKPVRYSEREPSFLSFLLRNLIEDFMLGYVSGSLNSKVCNYNANLQKSYTYM